MAININPVHIPKAYVYLVSLTDDAIDWNASFPDVHEAATEEEVLTGVEAKKHKYKEDYDIKNLVFIAGKLPTVFKFKNPSILANKEALDSARTEAFISLNPKQKKPSPGALNRCIWNACFCSYSQGLDGEAEYTVTKNTVASEYLQAFSDAGVLSEFALVINTMADSKKKS